MCVCVLGRGGVQDQQPNPNFLDFLRFSICFCFCFYFSVKLPKVVCWSPLQEDRLPLRRIPDPSPVRNDVVHFCMIND